VAVFPVSIRAMVRRTAATAMAMGQGGGRSSVDGLAVGSGLYSQVRVWKPQGVRRRRDSGFCLSPVGDSGQNQGVPDRDESVRVGVPNRRADRGRVWSVFPGEAIRVEGRRRSVRWASVGDRDEAPRDEVWAVSIGVRCGSGIPIG
jgi:hypothetical protein